MGFVLLAAPIIAVLLFLFCSKRTLQHTVSVLTSTVLLITAVFITRGVLLWGKIEYQALGGIFYVDSLSIIVLDIVLIISFLVSIYSVSYMENEIKNEKIAPGKLKIFYVLKYSFIFTMILALTVKNMGIMWIAIEATTLASAFLVSFYSNRYALEAAWKYIIICSVGIALALLGIIFLHLSSIEVLHGSQYLDWPALCENAKLLNPSVVRLAFIFILVGFGTKAGLAPMHTWLPDAHSQAPSPVSALLSGVLLNSAMYGIIRTVAIVNRNLGSNAYVGRLLIAVGVLSIATAAIFIITQRDYKRLLAYSSIEHMGIIAVAVGVFTPLSIFGALLHMINHSFTKSMLFLSSGRVLQKYSTKDISKTKGVLRVIPITGTAFLLGLFAIAGTPPFSVFASKLNIAISIFEIGGFWLGAIFLLLLAVVFVGIALNLFRIFYGQDYVQDKKTSTPSAESNFAGIAVIMVLLTIISITGIFIPYELKELVLNAQNIIIGS
ncbi:MAG: hydrogenase 4 subunit F [Clostridia bacterium]|nr:hydrogenase 4 subunit F [Clostridia bacterium]